MRAVFRHVSDILAPTRTIYVAMLALDLLILTTFFGIEERDTVLMATFWLVAVSLPIVAIVILRIETGAMEHDTSRLADAFDMVTAVVGLAGPMSAFVGLLTHVDVLVGRVALIVGVSAFLLHWGLTAHDRRLRQRREH